MFLVPPSLEELENRIRSRGTETAAQIEARLGKANAEMALMKEYDYRIVNDRVDDVVCRIEAIMTAERLSMIRYIQQTKE